MSREKARAGKVVVQREKTPAKTKTSAHFVAAKNAESSSDDSSDSSDSEPGFSLTPRWLKFCYKSFWILFLYKADCVIEFL